MNNFRELIKYQRTHSSIHNKSERNFRKAATAALTDDPSCIACNPLPKEIPQPFLNFFEWVQKVLGAILYISKSLEAFQIAISADTTGVQEIYYQQILKTLRYKQVPILTFKRAVDYCLKAQTETELFQKKYQGDLLNYLNISL